jgi:hypothetical protein
MDIRPDDGDLRMSSLDVLEQEREIDAEPLTLPLGPHGVRAARAAFVSDVPFEAERIHAAAVYCSDGRFGQQMDEFLQRGLGFPRYDRVAVPGGAAPLAEHMAVTRERAALERQVRFLVEAHELQRVVLIAHQDCAFYRLVRVRGSLEQQQVDDLARAADRIRALAPHLAVEAYFALKMSDQVWFEPVPC